MTRDAIKMGILGPKQPAASGKGAWDADEQARYMITPQRYPHPDGADLGAFTPPSLSASPRLPPS